MFRPIKNLITYIQKNASGSAIFGNTTTTGTVGATVADEAAIVEETFVKEIDAKDKNVDYDDDDDDSTTDVNANANANAHNKEIDKMEEVMEKSLNDVDTTLSTTTMSMATTTTVETVEILKTITESTTIKTLNETYDEAEDIELQIKSSIMLKQPLHKLTSNGTLDAQKIVKKIISLSPGHHHDYNQNQALDDELEDFRHDPMQGATVVDDFCSLDSAEQTAGEELNTEEEDVEEPFLKFVPELETIANSEIIVLNDTDMNSSIASDVPSEDPLAIDDYTQPSLLKENLNPLDTSSINDEASTSGDMLWLDVDDKTSLAPTPTLLTPSLRDMPQKRPALDSLAHEKPHKIASVEQAEELPSDGSDSGLGSETSTLHNTLKSIVSNEMATAVATTSSLLPLTNLDEIVAKPRVEENEEDQAVASIECSTNAIATTTSTSKLPLLLGNHVPLPTNVTTVSVPKLPLRSNLKRRHLIVDDDMLDPAPTTSDASNCLVSQQKKPKRSINFDSVQVYYFPRQQGFSCVPSAGGCTLGMASQHVATKTLTLAEHAAELRRAHRLQLQEINPRISSSDESEESEEDYLSEGSASDQDAETNGFLQPVPPKQRRALLKAAGVRKIDASEKAECRDIRNSREVCGCTCRDFCDPETCACNQAGIKCQVDRAMFPCGCSRDACANTVGRVEFNPTRVRTHYIHTIMRLEMEHRQQQQPPPTLAYGMVAMTQTSATHSQGYYNSNYSSGYASPAYTNETTTTATVMGGTAANYYQPQTPTASSSPYMQHHHHQLQHQHQLHQQQQYQLDASLVDGNSLYAASSTRTPTTPSSYGELSTAVYHNLNYASGNGMQTQVSAAAYASYQQHSMQSNASYCDGDDVTTYSSCAVPSEPPYGSATTTVASAQYHSECNVVTLETTAPSCSVLDGSGGGSGGGVGGGDSSFIDLNTPIASSSRLSQINDLLQHNRNTTAALVAVSQGPTAMHTANNNNSNNMNNVSLHTSIATTATSKIMSMLTSTSVINVGSDSDVQADNNINNNNTNCNGIHFEELPTNTLTPSQIIESTSTAITTACMLDVSAPTKLPAPEPPPAIIDNVDDENNTNINTNNATSTTSTTTTTTITPTATTTTIMLHTLLKDN